MQATRPRVITAPLQLALGVQMHHHFSSKFLIDSLYSHGFCVSYTEVRKFERNAALAQGIDLPGFTPDQCMQYAGDNVDHDLCTIDGKNTFHGMGIIATVTPALKTKRVVPRRNVTPQEIADIARINILPYLGENSALDWLTYGSLNTKLLDQSSNIDLLWKTSLLLQTPRPEWSGFMQMVKHGHHAGKSSVMFLPIIDMNPNDMSCIYSTLHFISEHARKHSATPIVTFDQPLWWKAHMIVESEANDSVIHSIVVRLGGFHTEMSFLGSIGHIMEGSGLLEVLQLVYANNSEGHMLSGKAVRGHMIVDSVLNTILLARVFDCNIPTFSTVQTNTVSHPETEVQSQNEDLKQLTVLFEQVNKCSKTEAEITNDSLLNNVQVRLELEKKSLQESRTARLWLQYMTMVDILKCFLQAERTGDWELHLKCLYDMLPYLLASGHNLYSKSIYLYLQKMDKLKENYPQVYEHFLDGHHVVRRSDRFWAGLSVDLIIEQVLMRSIKATGGLTRGSGMSETQRAIWTLAMPVCAEVNSAMQDFTGVTYHSSEQHKETSKSRMKRDMEDTISVLTFLESRNPFSQNQCLRSIATGITAEAHINVDNCKAIGSEILQLMKGQLVKNTSFKRKNQASTMGTKTDVKLKDRDNYIDPQLLFQRLLAAGKHHENVSDIFTYKLCVFPPALFESKNMLLSANKSLLADALWSPSCFSEPCPDVTYVLDGGALLHRIPWFCGETWKEPLTR